MFAVIFELAPKPDRLTEYSQILRQMRPQVEQIPGFISSERFASREPAGRFMVVSLWADERAIATYRANQFHHSQQMKARTELLNDYRLSVGRVVSDGGEVVPPSRFGDPEPRRYVALAAGPASRFNQPSGMWYDSMYEPGKALVTRDASLESVPMVFAEMRRSGALEVKLIAISRDYGMFEREDAPQFMPAPPAS